MKLGIALATATLALLPSIALAAGCSHDKQAVSCAIGTIYDAATGSCVVDGTT
ncbi:adenylosuccinate lyase [Sulfitobacter sp. SK012]|nr:adenylosuccinate lyase [Sulfitobacter sp. SK012]